MYEALFPSIFDREFLYERLPTENHWIPKGDFSKTLKEIFIEKQKEDSILIQLQPVKINLEAKEILVGEEKSIYSVDAILKYENKLLCLVTQKRFV